VPSSTEPAEHAELHRIFAAAAIGVVSRLVDN
jgi:hypothetical protein